MKMVYLIYNGTITIDKKAEMISMEPILGRNQTTDTHIK